MPYCLPLLGMIFNAPWAVDLSSNDFTKRCLIHCLWHLWRVRVVGWFTFELINFALHCQCWINMQHTMAWMLEQYWMTVVFHKAENKHELAYKLQKINIFYFTVNFLLKLCNYLWIFWRDLNFFWECVKNFICDMFEKKLDWDCPSCLSPEVWFAPEGENVIRNCILLLYFFNSEPENNIKMFA